MDDLPSAIRHDAWLVRHYHRNKLRRQQAILRLGHTVRNAFIQSNDYEALLKAIVDGLRPKEDEPPF